MFPFSKTVIKKPGCPSQTFDNFAISNSTFNRNESIGRNQFLSARQAFCAAYQRFFERLRYHSDIVVKTNGMSTQIFGEYGHVMDILKAEIGKSFEQPYGAFVLKVINADLNHVDGSR